MLIPEVTKKTGSELKVQGLLAVKALKLVESAKGARRLLQEAAALMALQSTGLVAELWNPECLKLHLEHGILTNIYHPTQLENNSFKWMSLAETEETLYQLLQVLSVVHESGWIWFGLKRGHILFNLNIFDPRDSTPPMRIAGFENALH